MKTLHKVAVFGILCVAGCSHAPVANPVDLSPAISNVNKADEALTKATHEKNPKEAMLKVQEAKQSLQEVRKSLLDQQNLANQLAATRDWWMHHSADQDKEITQLREKLVHFHHLLFISSALFAIFAGLLVSRLAFVAGPYALYAGGIAGVLAFGAAWATLSHL